MPDIQQESDNPFEWVNQQPVEPEPESVSDPEEENPFEWVNQNADVALSKVVPSPTAPEVVEQAKKVESGLLDLIKQNTVGTYRGQKMDEQQNHLYAKFIQTGIPAFKEHADAMDADVAAAQPPPLTPGQNIGMWGMVRGATELVGMIPDQIKGAKRGIEKWKALGGDDGSILALGKRLMDTLAPGAGKTAAAVQGFLFDSAEENGMGAAYKYLKNLRDPATGESIPDEIAIPIAKAMGGVAGTINTVLTLSLAGRSGALAATGVIEGVAPGVSPLVKRLVGESVATALNSPAVRGALSSGA